MVALSLGALTAPPLGELPALPLHEAGKYVAGAYIAAFVLVLVYVTIMGIRLSRIERHLGELLDEHASVPPERSATAEVPALEQREAPREESTLV